MQLRITAAAAADLQAISFFTAEMWGSHRANVYVDLLVEDCKLLLQFPLLGRRVVGSRRELRRYRSKQYIVLYGVTDDAVEIVRIMHHSRKPISLNTDDK